MSENVANTLPVGWMLKNQYRIESVIGCGGFGVTYLATDLNEKRRVAIKEFYPNQSVVRNEHTGRVSVIIGQEDYIDHLYQRFWDEGKLIYALKDVPDILQVYHVFEENNTAYIVMEYLEGQDLSHYLKENKYITWELLSKYLRLVLVSLEGIHQKGMIHRDISPDNIFITNKGRAKLIDFGSLRAYRNQNMTTILKHGFAPYEQYQTEGKQGPYTDLYSLAVSVYYSLTGILPPKAIDRMTGAAIKPINTIRQDVPPHVIAALDKAMAVKKEDRYQSARDMFLAIFPEKISFMLCCTSGAYAGQQWKVESKSTITFGREGGNVIQLPANTVGVSRKHCMVSIDEMGQLYIRDENSTYGTMIQDNRIAPMNWTRFYIGQTFKLGNEQFEIIEMN